MGCYDEVLVHPRWLPEPRPTWFVVEREMQSKDIEANMGHFEVDEGGRLLRIAYGMVNDRWRRTDAEPEHLTGYTGWLHVYEMGPGGSLRGLDGEPVGCHSPWYEARLQVVDGIVRKHELVTSREEHERVENEGRAVLEAWCAVDIRRDGHALVEQPPFLILPEKDYALKCGLTAPGTAANGVKNPRPVTCPACAQALASERVT